MSLNTRVAPAPLHSARAYALKLIARAEARVAPTYLFAVGAAAIAGLTCVMWRRRTSELALLAPVVAWSMLAGHVFVDRAAVTTAASPVTRRTRAVIRAVAGTAVIAVSWGVVTGWVSAISAGALHVRAWSLQFSALVAVSSAASCARERRDPAGNCGVAGASAVSAAVACIFAYGAIREGAPMFGRSDSIWMWWALLALSLCAMWHCTRDQCDGSVLRRLRSRAFRDR